MAKTKITSTSDEVKKKPKRDILYISEVNKTSNAINLEKVVMISQDKNEIFLVFDTKQFSFKLENEEDAFDYYNKLIKSWAG